MNIRCWIDTLILRDPEFDTETAESDAKDEPAKNNEEKRLQAEEQRGQGEDHKLSCDDTDLVQKGIAMHIKSVSDRLNQHKEMLQKIEEAEIRKQMSLIVLDPGAASDRYSRSGNSPGTRNAQGPCGFCRFKG